MRLSEIAAATAVVCLLLALLTWFLLRGISTDSADYAATLRIFDDFALAEASLHRDVLQARAGLLQNYDPLNASVAQIDFGCRAAPLESPEGGVGYCAR